MLREIALTILNASTLLLVVLVAVPVLAWAGYWCYVVALSVTGAVSTLVGSTYREIDTKERKRRERSKLDATSIGVGSGIDHNLVARSVRAKRIRSLHRQVRSTAIQCWEAKRLVAMGLGGGILRGNCWLPSLRAAGTKNRRSIGDWPRRAGRVRPCSGKPRRHPNVHQL